MKHLPKSFKFRDRERSVEQMEPEQLEDFIRLAREVMQQELQERCFDKKISNSLGSSIYVETDWHGCPESARETVHHHGNFVQDIHP